MQARGRHCRPSFLSIVRRYDGAQYLWWGCDDQSERMPWNSVIRRDRRHKEFTCRFWAGLHFPHGSTETSDNGTVGSNILDQVNNFSCRHETVVGIGALTTVRCDRAGLLVGNRNHLLGSPPAIQDLELRSRKFELGGIATSQNPSVRPGSLKD